MFKENDRRRFKCPNKLATDGGQTTDPSEILSKYFYPPHRWLKTNLKRLLHHKGHIANITPSLKMNLDIREIHLAVKHLKCGKAAGPDGITA